MQQHILHLWDDISESQQHPPEKYKPLNQGSSGEFWDSIKQQEIFNLLEPEDNIGNS